MSKEYFDLLRNLDSKILEVRNAYERSQVFENKVSVASVYEAYRESYVLLEEILTRLKENKIHIKKKPKEYRGIIKVFIKNLNNLKMSLNLITKDKEFVSNVDPEKIETMVEDFREIDEKTKKFLTEISEDNEAWLLLR
jgi:pyrrolidone-carboxylate peptidase